MCDESRDSDDLSTQDSQEMLAFEESEEEAPNSRRTLVPYEELLFSVLKEHFRSAKMARKVPLNCSKTLGLEMKVATKHNYAIFKCGNCDHEWSTHKTLVDFSCTYEHPRGGRVKVQKLWGQNCSQCEANVSPLFCSSASSNAAVWNTGAQITREILRRFYGDKTWQAPVAASSKGRSQKPHDRNRCEACRAGVCSMGTLSVNETRRTPTTPTTPTPPRDPVRRPISWYMQVGGVDQPIIDIRRRTPAQPVTIRENPAYWATWNTSKPSWS